MVVAGNISDRYGMLKMTRIALVLSIVGSLMLIITNSVVSVVSWKNDSRIVAAF